MLERMYEDVNASAGQGEEGPDQHPADAPANGGAPGGAGGGPEGGATPPESAPPVGWQRLGRARSAPVGMAIYDSAGPVRGEFSDPATVNRLWRQGHAHLGGVTPLARRSEVVPALPDEYMAALGWREVQAPTAKDEDEVIRAFLGPVPTWAEAEALGREWGWHEPEDNDGDPMAFPDHSAAGGNSAGAGGGHSGASAYLLAHADPDPVARPWPLADDADRLPVGVALGADGRVVDVGAIARQRIDGPAVTALEGVQVDDADAYTVVEAIAAWNRIEAWAAYEKRMLARELTTRAQLGTKGQVSTEARTPVATAEIAFRLGITRQGARQLVDAGAAMGVGAGMIAGDALREGEINAPKADMVIERTAHLPPDLALGVQDEVLRGDGAMRTLPQLRRAVDAAVARVDPEEFNDAHARARQKRCVGTPQKLPHGMASTRIVWSAADAMALHAALEAAARNAKTEGNDRGRTLDQLRTDALASMAHSVLTSGRIGPAPGCASNGATDTSAAGHHDAAGQDGHEGPASQDHRADNDPEVHRPRGGPGAPFGLGGSGEVDQPGCTCPPEPASEVATPEVSAERREAEASTAVSAALEADTAPEVKPQAEAEDDADAEAVNRAEPNHAESGPIESGTVESGTLESGTAEFDQTESDQAESDQAESEYAEPDGARPAPSGHVCTGSGQCGPVAAEPFVLGTVGGAKAQIRITVPLSTLMGDSDEAGELEGYGPIPADVARAHAAGGTWKRLVSDPLTDRVLEVTAKEYKPPGWLREQVIANTPYCVAPGCGVQARHTDLDHGISFLEGPTAAWNLHPVCRHHHRLKTEGHLCYHSPAEGAYEWTTPTGHRYRADATGTYLLDPAGTSDTDDPDPPPF